MHAAHCLSDGIADKRRSNSRGWCGDADLRLSDAADATNAEYSYSNMMH